MPILKAKNGNGKTCTMSKIFIDTNILVYALDVNETEDLNDGQIIQGIRIKNPLNP
jgi:predicted nucleic acid-binding protein